MNYTTTYFISSLFISYRTSTPLDTKAIKAYYGVYSGVKINFSGRFFDI